MCGGSARYCHPTMCDDKSDCATRSLDMRRRGHCLKFNKPTAQLLGLPNKGICSKGLMPDGYPCLDDAWCLSGTCKELPAGLSLSGLDEGICGGEVEVKSPRPFGQISPWEEKWLVAPTYGRRLDDRFIN